MLTAATVAVARSSSDDTAIRYVLPVFLDDVTFWRSGPNTDPGYESATQRIIHRDSLGGAAELRTRDVVCDRRLK